MRSSDAVRECWAAFRTECWEWFAASRRLPLDGGKEWWIAEGPELRPLEPQTVMELGLLEAIAEDQDAKTLSVKTAREDLWRSLSEGKITATGLDVAGAAVQIPAHKWHYLELAGDLGRSDYVIQRSVSLNAAYTELRFLRSDVVRLWPALTSEAETPLFDISKSDWTLWEAAIWVGCGGKALSSQKIGDDDLDEKGAAALFAAMFHEKLGATGLNRQLLRESIPPPYWELATTDPNQFGERHYVSFIDDTLEDYGGQFTPYREASPKWFGIQIKRDALLGAFPEFSGATPNPPADSECLPAVRSVRSADKLAATKQAIAECYPNGLPQGLTVKDRLNTINQWHVKNGSSQVSATTVLRALNSK